MNTGKPQRGFHWLASVLVAFIVGGCANTQVTNNTGSLLDTVKVGSVAFSQNLDYCGDGCSTGFKWVSTGDHKISVRETPIASWTTVGTVGPFKQSRFFSVNVRRVTPPFGRRAQYCVELWRRFDTGGEFNNDSTKQLIVSRCPKGASQSEEPPSVGARSSQSQVTNNSQSLLHKVKIGTVEFTENLDSCGTGCSTGFSTVAAGDNQIMLQQTSSSPWQTLSDPLGPFEHGPFYSVNITSSGGGLCAALWTRGNNDVPFNEDTGKHFIESHCF